MVKGWKTGRRRCLKARVEEKLTFIDNFGVCVVGGENADLGNNCASYWESLFDPCCCFLFCAFLYTGQTDVKEIGSQRVEFEITSPTFKKY